MNSIVFVCLIGYLGTLAATQTVYGWGFMNLRWIALLVLVAVSGLSWLIMRSQKGLKLFLDKSSIILLVYFLVTFSTVIEAENPLFSGLRWSSHTMMLTIFLVFIRQNLTFNQVQKIQVVLKIIIAVLLFLSLLNPAPQTIYDSLQVFRGAMGNANTMGQIAAIGTIIYFHSFLTRRGKWLRYLEFFLVCISMAVLWWTGSRSALITVITGIGLIIVFYRQMVRNKMFWIIYLICLVSLISPTLPYKVKQFIYKSEDPSSKFMIQMTKSRSEIWSAAWEGFKSRPVYGWGFGADSEITKDWTIRLTALGTVKRDAVNDFLFMLEGCGVIGLGAYLLLIYIALKQRLTRRQVLTLEKINYKRLDPKEYYLTVSHIHAIMFILAISLLVLVQFDNTALSAGNFISVVIWLSVASAGSLRKEVLSKEFGIYYYSITKAQGSQRKPFTLSSFRQLT